MFVWSVNFVKKVVVKQEGRQMAGNAFIVKGVKNISKAFINT
jgi:hypothetical protein